MCSEDFRSVPRPGGRTNGDVPNAHSVFFPSQGVQKSFGEVCTLTPPSHTSDTPAPPGEGPARRCVPEPAAAEPTAAGAGGAAGGGQGARGEGAASEAALGRVLRYLGSQPKSAL